MGMQVEQPPASKSPLQPCADNLRLQLAPPYQIARRNNYGTLTKASIEQPVDLRYLGG